MMGGAKAHYDCIKAFSETDFTEDLKAITDPGPGDARRGRPDRADRQFGAQGDQAAANGTLKTYPGLSHAPFATHPEVVNPDLLAFAKA
jgi:non-heme chloroperoxidase